MSNYYNALFFLAIISIFGGCTNEHKQEILKEQFREDIKKFQNNEPAKSAIETLEVDAEHFKIIQTDIPDREQIKQVKILGAKLDDVIALITEATSQDIIFQLQSDTINNSAQYANGSNTLANIQTNNTITNGDNQNYDAKQIRESKIYVSASNIGFGRLLKKAIGDKLSISYSDETYYLGYLKTTTLKIPSLSGLVDKLKKTLETMGALNVVHDPLSSSVTFSAREKEYADIMKYLEVLRNNLYVIEYDIAIYNVELSDNYTLGINWDLLPNTKKSAGVIAKTTSAFGAAGASTTSAGLGAVFNTVDLSGTALIEALTQFGKVESIQRPKLLGIAGTDVTLIDGLDEPYIKELRTTTLGDSAAQTSTVSASALSGIKVTLNSNVMDATVITDISLEINDIIGYNNFEVDKITYTQPRVHTKNIKSNMRVQPGVPIVISGLFRKQSDKGYKGIPGIANTPARVLGGSDYESKSKTEMVIIVTPRVIKYVMK